MTIQDENSRLRGIAIALDNIEKELKSLEYWADEAPDQEAFNSTSPFFMDTMELHEWLQFVLIFRFRDMIFRGCAIPTRLSVFPYAYEFYREDLGKHKALLKAIYDLDSFFEKNESA